MRTRGHGGRSRDPRQAGPGRGASRRTSPMRSARWRARKRRGSELRRGTSAAARSGTRTRGRSPAGRARSTGNRPPCGGASLRPAGGAGSDGKAENAARTCRLLSVSGGSARRAGSHVHHPWRQPLITAGPEALSADRVRPARTWVTIPEAVPAPQDADPAATAPATCVSRAAPVARGVISALTTPAASAAAQTPNASVNPPSLGRRSEYIG